jgi:hypothetical protein
MSRRTCFPWLFTTTWLLIATLACLLVHDVRAENSGAGQAKTPILCRESPDQPWRVLKPGDNVPSGAMVVAVPGGSLDSRGGAVHLSLLSDLARLSPFPVLESAVVLHDTPGKDLDFTLDRGRVDLTNHRKEGAAKVQIHFHKQVWDVTLAEPGTRVALELYGRWPRGVPFNKDPRSQDEPTAELVFLVLQGRANLQTGVADFAMHAPPGPAYYHWDSVGGGDPAPQPLSKLPDWASPRTAMQPKIQDVLTVLKEIQKKLGEATSLEGALLNEALESDNPNARRMAVYGMGAIDDLAGLTDALSNPRHEDVRQDAIVTLRHWIGRKPGQDLKLYEFLIKEKKYTPNQAEIILQLLHSFSDADRSQPATYETLIEYLLHDKLAIRQLAKWHLARLAPSGKLEFDPAASPEELQKVYAQWKEFIPTGKLPPRGKSE